MLVAHIQQYGIKLVLILEKICGFTNIERQGSKYTNYWTIHQFLTKKIILKNTVIHAKLKSRFQKMQSSMSSDKIANVRPIMHKTREDSLLFYW